MVLQNLPDRIIWAFRDWCRYRATVEELSCLPDGMLTDLGTSRSQIRRFAWRMTWPGEAHARNDERNRSQVLTHLGSLPRGNEANALVGEQLRAIPLHDQSDFSTASPEHEAFSLAGNPRN
jgi:uncharacterized protein YjiS (DUF1127 family)